MKNDMTVLVSVFTTMEHSKFLCGDNKNGWKASFDWIFENSNNWVKVLEGNYDKVTSEQNRRDTAAAIYAGLNGKSI
jgi:hypothetical protein